MTSGRRVVISGIGLVTPLGVGTKVSWNSLLAGMTAGVAVTSSASDKQSGLFAAIPSKVCTRVPEGSDNGQYNPQAHFSPSEMRQMSKASAFALLASQEALRDAGLLNNHTAGPPSHDRWGVSVGSSIMDVDDISASGEYLSNGRYKQISPYFIPRVLNNMPAGLISIRHGITGPCLCPVAACATGAVALGDALHHIRSGRVDVMLAGGTDACVSPIVMAGFARMRALSTAHNDQPHLASRPFDNLRDGFVMGEGAGVVVLEELDHFERRRSGANHDADSNAKIYAELTGYGATADALHMAAPGGSGAVRAMQTALTDANTSPAEVGYVNAHATSTPVGDAIEATAIETIFESQHDECANGRPGLNGAASELDGCEPQTVHVSSCKGAVGHLQGAAGAVEAAFTALTIYHKLLPPSVNCFEANCFNKQTDTEGKRKVVQLCPSDRVLGWKSSPRVALTNSFGFGGVNCCLVLRSFD